MSNTIVARDLQTAQSLYDRSLKGDLIEVNRQGLIQTASMGTRAVVALIGFFQGSQAAGNYQRQCQQQVAQAFASLCAAQRSSGSTPQPALQQRQAQALDNPVYGATAGDSSVKGSSAAYELPTDALALLARNGQAAVAPSAYGEVDEAQGDVQAYAASADKAPLDYIHDPALSHLKATAQFVKSEIEQHGTDAGRALQNIGLLKTLSNANQASNGEILKELTPALHQQYASELQRLKTERAERGVAQGAANAAYKAASLDQKDLPIHGLLQSPLFAQAPEAQRVVSNAYLDVIDGHHARGKANYDRQAPSNEILRNKYLQRDALVTQFGPDNKDSAISKALSAQVSDQKTREEMLDAFKGQLQEAALQLILDPQGLQTPTHEFAAKVDAMVQAFIASPR